jgi:hypothetical protein
MNNEICISCGFPKEHGNCPTCRKLTDNERIQEIREHNKRFWEADTDYLLQQLEQRDKTIAEFQHQLEFEQRAYGEGVLERDRLNTLMLSALEDARDSLWSTEDEFNTVLVTNVTQRISNTIEQVKALTVSKQGVSTDEDGVSE